MTIIQRELQRGVELSEKIIAGKRPWSDLFTKHTFFTAGYKYYICVIATSKSKEAHKVWSGYVESKVRMLVQRIETHASIALAHPFVKGYERRHRCNSDEEVAMVREGSLAFLFNGPEEPDVSEIKHEAVGAGVPQDGTSDSKAGVKAEPIIKQEDGVPPQQNGTAASQQEQGPPIKAEPNTEADAKTKIETEIKTEPESTVPQPPKPMTVYTNTHYIGLELAPGTDYLSIT